MTDTRRNGDDGAVADTATSFDHVWWGDAVLASSTHDPDTGSGSTDWISTYRYDPLGRLGLR